MEFFKANIQREVRLSFMSTGLGQAHNGDLSHGSKARHERCTWRMGLHEL